MKNWASPKVFKKQGMMVKEDRAGLGTEKKMLLPNCPLSDGSQYTLGHSCRPWALSQPPAGEEARLDRQVMPS